MDGTTLPATDLPDLPVTRGCPYRPPAGYDRLRGDGPVTRVRLAGGQAAWLVTGYAEARALLFDARLSSSRLHPSFPWREPLPSITKLRDEATAPLLKVGTTLTGADPPEHTRQRRLLAPSFTTRRVEALRPGIARVVEDRLDAMAGAGPPADLHGAFSVPVASTVISRLLGVPYEDHARFEADARLRLDPERGGEALGRLWAYLDGLIAAKEATPGEGLLDDLIARRDEESGPDRTELLAFALLLLIGGLDSSASTITLGTLALLEHPDQLARLRTGACTVPTAVEELLRYTSVQETTSRVATADIEIAGVVIGAGDGVMIANGAANHDPGHLDGPGELDVGRQAPHLAFGYGLHQCLGQGLARVELEVAFDRLVDRLPGLRLAVAPAQLRPTTSLPAGVRELPVTW